MSINWAAVITAGGYADPNLEAKIGCRVKSLAHLGSRSLLTRAVEAIQAAGIHEIVVVGDSQVLEALQHNQQVKHAERGANPARSAENGIQSVSSAENILFFPADTPFITQEHVKQFCEACEHRAQASKDWLALGICSKRAVQAELPNAPYRYVRLREGAFATSSLQAGTRHAFHSALNLLSQISENRKSKLAVARMFGITNVVRLLTGNLTIPTIEARAAKWLQSDCFIIRDTHPLASFDIDDVADWEYAQNFSAKE